MKYYKLIPVTQQAGDKLQTTSGKHVNIDLFRVQRIAGAGVCKPSIELKQAFARSSDELQAIFSEVVSRHG
jgi:hypothetical protein